MADNASHVLNKTSKAGNAPPQNVMAAKKPRFAKTIVRNVGAVAAIDDYMPRGIQRASQAQANRMSPDTTNTADKSKNVKSKE